jgi:hypothetical protein
MKPIIVFECGPFTSPEQFDRMNNMASDVAKKWNCFVLIVEGDCKVKVFQPITLALMWYRIKAFFGLVKLHKA